MDPAWLGVGIAVLSFVVTLATILVSIGRAQRAGEAKATETAKEVEAVLLAKLESTHSKLLSEFRDMREKVSVEMAVLKRDLEQGRSDFKTLREFDSKLDDRLRKVEMDIAVWKRHTGAITPETANKPRTS